MPLKSCKFCKEKFRSCIKLVEHLEMVELKSNKDEASKTRMQTQIQELLTRTNAVPEEIHCFGCNKDYANKYALHKHVKDVHKGVYPISPDKIPPKTKEQLKAEAKELRKNKVCSFNYLNAVAFLEEFDGRAETYNFISSQCYRKVLGDVLILDKVFFDGDNPDYYPIRCLSLKPLQLEYLDINCYWVNNPEKLSNIFRSIVQDCYLIYNNMAIEDRVNGKNDKLFTGHDILYWQDRISEYLDSKYQERMMHELGRHLVNKVKTLREQKSLPTSTGIKVV